MTSWPRRNKSSRLDPLSLPERYRAQLAAQGVFPSGKARAGNGRIQRAPAEQRTADGIVFASKWEMNCYLVLRDAFGPDRLRLQPVFVLQEGFVGPDGKKVRAIHYVADFLVDERWVLDAKGMLTERFRLNEKMFMHRYGVPVEKLHTKSQLHNLVARMLEPCPNKTRVSCSKYTPLPSRPTPTVFVSSSPVTVAATVRSKTNYSSSCPGNLDTARWCARRIRS